MPPLVKERLDCLLVEQGLCPSRSQAQGLILAGKVRVNGVKVEKPGTLTQGDAKLEVEALPPYVSRGGLKLEKALTVFGVSVENRLCLDVGASTGGFTDCLLQRGAQAVAAIDVGYGQLDWKLRQDPRVFSMEKTNIRNLMPADLPVQATLAVIDVSFISLKKVLPQVVSLLEASSDREVISLLKPQFEYKDYLDDKSFKGVVVGRESHRTILQKTLDDLRQLMPDWGLSQLTYSPITGPKGNKEFLLHWQPLSIQQSHLNEGALIENALIESDTL